MTVFYTIYLKDAFANERKGFCCAESDVSREDAIQQVEEYCASLSEELGEYGEHTVEATLITYDDESDNDEEVESIKITYEATPPFSEREEWGTLHRGYGGVI